MKKLLSIALAAALALSAAVPVSAAGGAGAEKDALGYFTGAINDSQYTDSNPWTIGRRVIVEKADNAKHESGHLDTVVYAGDPGYDPAKDTLNAGWHYAEGVNGDYYTPNDRLNDLIKPGETLYLTLNPFWVYLKSDFPTVGGLQDAAGTLEGRSIFDYDDYLDVKIKKGDNAKYIESIKLVDREFDAADIEFLTDPSTDGLPGYAAGPGMNAHDRSYYAQVRLKDFQQDKEAGVTFKLEIKVKKDIDLRGAQAAWGNAWFGLYPPESYWLPEDVTTLVPGVDVIPKGTKITLESDRLWINNLVVDADADFAAGDRGLMVKPSKNDGNEITWENDGGTIARATFLGDSDPGKFYAKLSTRWDSGILDGRFADTDACVYAFSGKPTMTGVTRVKLELANPFVGRDGEELIDPEEIRIYQLIDEDTLEDVTAEFRYTGNDGGDLMFTAKDRTFGTYVFSADAAAAAKAQEEAGRPLRVPTGIMLSSRA